MSATMARQGGRVQLEQSDMRLALIMAKKTNGGFSCASRDETRFLIKTPGAEVRDKTKWGVEFPGQNQLNVAIERHTAVLHRNHMAGCLPWQNATAKTPETRW